MTIYNADERLHRAAAQQAQRDKYILRWLANGLNPLDRKSFGRQAESAVIDRLRAAGYHVTRAGANEHYDLIVNGLRVEIKAASCSGGRYQAALRRNAADVLIMVCCTGKHDCYFVIPFERVAGLTHIEIRNTDPARYAGRLSAWREAWHLLDQLIARGINHRQPALL